MSFPSRVRESVLELSIGRAASGRWIGPSERLEAARTYGYGNSGAG
jgi:hypothetical protein